MSNKQQLQTNNNKQQLLILLLLGKAAGGGSDVPTCTIEIINETIGSSLFESRIRSLWYVAYENNERKLYSFDTWNENVSVVPDGFDSYAVRNVLNNVICGQMIVLIDEHNGRDITSTTLVEINGAVDNLYLYVPMEPNLVHQIRIISFD